MFVPVGILAAIAFVVAMRSRDRISLLEQEVAALRRLAIAADADAARTTEEQQPIPAPATSPLAAHDSDNDGVEEHVEATPTLSESPSDTISSLDMPPKLEPASAPMATTSATPEELGPDQSISIEPLPPRTSAPVRAKPLTLEERLGTRLFVWVGGIAIALAGIFLVKYTIDAGLLSESVRVILGAVLGLSAISVGFKLHSRASSVAQSLVAAGIVDLYAVVWASAKLYDLIPESVGWILMAATTVAAVVFSLRFGAFVAGLGFVGGFSMPLLLGIRVLDPSMLFVHFVLLQIGVMFLATRTRAPGLQAISAIASSLWCIGWFLDRLDSTSMPWLGLFALTTTVTHTLGSRLAPNVSPATKLYAWLTNSVVLITLTGLLAKTNFGTLEWVFLLSFAAGSIVIGRIDKAQRGLPWMVGAVCAGLFASWANSTRDTTAIWSVLASLITILGVGGHLAARRAVRPEVWIALASIFSVAFGLIAHHVPLLEPAPWTLIFTGIVALFAGGSYALLRWRDQFSADAVFVQLCSVGVLVAITAWVAHVEFEFIAAWLSIAWISVAVVFSNFALRLRLPQLISAAVALALLAALRLTLDPVFHPDDFGATPIVSALPLLYTAVAAALLCIARRADEAQRSSDAHTLATTARLVILLGSVSVIHHAFTGSLRPSTPEPFEWSCVATIWLLAAIAMIRFPRFSPSATSVGITAMVLAVVGPCLLVNPLWTPWPVAGITLFNMSWFIYGLPAAVGLLWFARAWPLPSDQRSIAGTALASIVLTGATVQVRHAFSATSTLDGIFRSHAPQGAELYTYSAMWIAIAFAFLWIAYKRKAPAVRWASLVVMIATTGKIFWIDTGHLTGLYRVASFLGLGISLLAIGYLYQQSVFQTEEQTTAATGSR